MARPAVTSITPTHGTTAGGTTVTVTGTGFTGATGVKFGAVAATHFTVVSSTKITAVSPPQAVAAHNVEVTTSSGTSAAVPADLFTYEVAPGGSLVSGSPVHPTISVAGQQVTYKFTGVAGTHVTFDVSATKWTRDGVTGSANLTVSNPAGTATNSIQISVSPTHLELTVTVAGTWTLKLAANSNATGSATITYARDLTGALTSTVAVTPKITVRGRWAAYTFAGVAGKHVTFDVSVTKWTNNGVAGSANLIVFNPAGAVTNSLQIASLAAHLDFIPAVSGTWTVRLEPNNDSTGSATITYATDITGGLSSTVAVAPRIAIRGRWADYTFAGVAGKHVTFDVSVTMWNNDGVAGSANVIVSNPAGAATNSLQIASLPAHLDFTPTVSGTWTVRLEPNNDSTGGATITYATDITGGLSSTVAVTPRIAIRGRWADYTFASVAGRHVTFAVTATTWSNDGLAGSANLIVFNPAGAATNSIQIASLPAQLEFTPTVSGTWTVRLEPNNDSSGSATFDGTF